jgi:site-specific DNA-adenine methylase
MEERKRIGKELSEIIYEISIDIENEYDFEIKGYCEPFCGMLGVYQHIPVLFDKHNAHMKYKAGDTNKSVILMWQEAQKGWIPPITCTEKHFEELKNNGKDSAEKGFIGHQFGYGGQYFLAFRTKYGKSPIQKKASDNVVDISTKLHNVSFNYGDYKQFTNLKGYIIYCDPPYSKTTQYNDNFDSEKFWEWCEYMSENNIVFVSEYKAPKGILKIFSKKVKLTGKKTNTLEKTEKLFLLF